VPDPQRHAENRNLVERILNYIPGFHGYLQKDYRRESDHLARVWLENRLNASKRGLDDYQRALVDAGRLDGLTECERLRARLDRLINEIRSAVRGYSGFFDFVRVDEDLLDQVYQLDLSLMKNVEDLAASIEQQGQRGLDAPEDGIRQLLTRLDEVQKNFAERGALLQGLGK
jgi:hypothetical protein